MNTHATILPILVPFAAALLQLAFTRRGLAVQRNIGLVAALLGIAAAGWLVQLADGGALLVYALGGWAAPFGIVLAVDRLAAAMALLATLLALPALLYASAAFDGRGRHFHPLFQLQMVGIQGAFLTGDLFNLFVFFEVMLLASYALLAHGGGRQRTRAGVAYVVLNLAGSALFLIALGLIYGTLGTLNLADAVRQLQTLGNAAAPARLAGALLVTVFLLKAALLPLSFWLPQAYSAAGAPVATLFVIMTKVGVVAILRVQAVMFAPLPLMADLLDGWLVALALATVLLAALGTLAATSLRALAAWLVLASAGTLLVAAGFPQAQATSAALFYLIHSTFAGATFFLLAALIARRRGASADLLRPGPTFHAPWLACAFFICAASAAGLPPLSGFLGKLMLLEALHETAAGTAIWSVLLTSGFLIMISLARNGSRLFWDHMPDLPPYSALPAGWRRVTAAALLVAAAPLLVLFAGPVADYSARAAAQLYDHGAYIDAVLGAEQDAIAREKRP